MTNKKHPSLEDAYALKESTQPQEESTSMFQQALEAYKQVYAPHALPSNRLDRALDESISEEEEFASLEEEEHALPDAEEENDLSPSFVAFLERLSALPAGTTREQAYAPFPEQKKRIDKLLGVSEEHEATLRNPANPAVRGPRWTRLTTLFFCTSLVLLGVLSVSIWHLRQNPTVAHEALVRVDRPTPPLSPTHPTPSPDAIEKGAERSVQMLYVREPLTVIGRYATSRTTLREGDIVSFQFSFKQPAFVMIASLDEKGVVSFYHPHLASDDAMSPRLQGQGTIPENKSPQRSITLDASKGRESIFVIGSARPFTAKEIRTKFSSRYPRGSDLFQFMPFTSSSRFWMIRRFDIFKK